MGRRNAAARAFDKAKSRLPNWGMLMPWSKTKCPQSSQIVNGGIPAVLGSVGFPCRGDLLSKLQRDALAVRCLMRNRFRDMSLLFFFE